MHKIFYLSQADTSSAWYRIYTVSNQLQRQGLAYTTIPEIVAQNLKFDSSDTLQKYLLMYMVASDLVIAQMPSKIETLPLLEYAKAKGKKVIIETDDLVHKLHDGFDKEKIAQYEEIADNLDKLWGLADGFICTVAPLAQFYSNKFNKPAWVFKNYIDFDDERWNATKLEHNKLVIGWMGGNSHSKDLEIIKPVINEILDRYDVEFQFVAYCPEWLKKRLGHNVRYIPTTGAIDSYIPMMAQFDIGLCPLLDNEFNRCKSDLKYLEYSMLRIPTVASKAYVYTNIINNVNGLLVRNTTADWVKAITKLIEDKPLRGRLGSEAYNYVKGQRDIKENAYKYIEVVEKILCR